MSHDDFYEDDTPDGDELDAEVKAEEIADAFMDQKIDEVRNED